MVIFSDIIVFYKNHILYGEFDLIFHTLIFSPFSYNILLYSSDDLL